MRDSTATILQHPAVSAVDEAWTDYQVLAQAMLDSPRLAIDRQHCEATARAWATWRDAFIRLGRAA